MAKAKCYRLHITGNEKPEIRKRVANFSGQQKLVFDELCNVRKPRLAQDITNAIGKKLHTVQDPNRVTVYYLMIFEKMGIVKATVSDVVSADVEQTWSALVKKVNGDNPVVDTEEDTEEIETEESEEVEN